MVWQHFTKGRHTNRPAARLAQDVFQIGTNTHLGHVTVPALTACRALIAKATQIVTLIVTPVTETRDVKTRRTASVIVFIFKPFDVGRCTHAEVVVHNIMAQLTAAATQTAIPNIGG